MFKKNQEDEIEIKALLLGCSTVGKTNLINTCVGLDYDPKTRQSLSSYESYKTFINDKKKYKVHLQDTYGPKQFRYLSKKYFNESDIIIYVCDITSYYRMKELDFFMDMVKNEKTKDYIGWIVGNKIDLFLKVEKVDGKDIEILIKEYAESKGL